MPLEPFTSSAPLTMGVELELQLVSLSDYDLTASSPDLLHLLERKPFPGNVTPEITESMIEINSDVHTRHAELLAQLQLIRDTLVQAGETLNIGIAGGGTHPFQKWSERRIFSKPRFKEVSELYGYLAKQFTIFGQHVHIGCASGDDALYLLHALSRYVPHFIALSASSPYVQGNDTLFNSARLNSVFAFPMSGRAPFTQSWSTFENEYFAKMEHTGVIELRVCDTPLTVERAAALAVYLQALCRYLLERREEPPVEDDYLVYNYNRFQACRFGLDGTLVHPKTYESLSLREDILTTLRKMEPHGAALGGSAGLAHLVEVTHTGSDAQYLRDQFGNSGSVEGVVDAAIHRFRGR